MNIIQKLILGSLGSYTGARVAANIIEDKMRDYDTKVEPPISNVSIHVPTFDEEMFIEKSLDSITNQSVVNQYPEMFDYILIDSGSKDRTVQLAKHILDNLDKRIKTKIIQTDKRGKLTARNLATDQSNGDIIVAIDGDSIYPYHFLNTILKPFNNNNNDQNVIAANGSTIDYSIPGRPGWLHTLTEWFQQTFLTPNRLYGRHCAYIKDKFYEIGKFDETVNQFDLDSIMQEEEFGFGEKMATLGKVVWQMNATCDHLGGYKSYCRSIFANKEICSKYGIGIERFGDLNNINKISIPRYKPLTEHEKVDIIAKLN